jgi:hypothetical protein
MSVLPLLGSPSSGQLTWSFTLIYRPEMGLLEWLLIGLVSVALGGVLVVTAWWLTDAND